MVVIKNVSFLINGFVDSSDQYSKSVRELIFNMIPTRIDSVLNYFCASSLTDVRSDIIRVVIVIKQML